MKQDRTVEMLLPVEFTQAELDEKRDRICAALGEYDDVENEKTAVSKEYGERLKALSGEMRKLAMHIKAKQEDRKVSCKIQYHQPSTLYKTVVRIDTGEIVRTEPMSQSEQQDDMFDADNESLNRMMGFDKDKPNQPGV